VAQEGHPLLFGVASPRVSVTQTCVLAAEGGLDPLWIGPSGPVLAAGEVRDRRVVAMAFRPELSEHLPLTASFPLLVGNAVYWCAQPAAEPRQGNNRRTGEAVTVEGETLAWWTPGGGKRESVPVRGRWVELDRIGLWESAGGAAGSASLQSARETLLPAGPAGEKEGANGGGETLLLGDLSMILLWCVFGLMVLESWLFHRHAVY